MAGPPEPHFLRPTFRRFLMQGEERFGGPDPATVARIDAHISDWRQGDVIPVESYLHLVDPGAPLTPSAALAGNTESGQFAVARSLVEAMVITTHTCDLVRSASDRPYARLSPLVRLADPIDVDEAVRLLRPRYAHVPALGPDAFADFDVFTTVEKSVFLRYERIRGCATDEEEQRFRRALQRNVGRGAFPNDLQGALGRMIRRWRDKRTRDTDEGKALRAVDDVRLLPNPDWSAGEIYVEMLICPPSRGAAIAVLPDADWLELLGEWESRCTPNGVIRSVELVLQPLDELSARDYVDSDPLDLDALSPDRPAIG
jgi:hypothetical protein